MGLFYVRESKNKQRSLKDYYKHNTIAETSYGGELTSFIIFKRKINDITKYFHKVKNTDRT